MSCTHTKWLVLGCAGRGLAAWGLRGGRTWRGVSSVVVPYLMVSMFLFFLSCSLIVPKYQPSLTVPLKYRPSAACPTRFAPDTGGLIGHLAAFHIHAQHG